jgi:hypothetical protein
MHGHRAFLTAAISLLAPFAAAAADIGGAIVAAPGSTTVAGTTVEICPMPAGATQANCGALQPIVIQNGGAIGYFRFTGVTPGMYRIVAYRDLNRTGDMDAGDEAAVYTRYPNQEPSDVQPGRVDVAIRLIPFSGDVNELFEGRRRDRATFTGTVPADPALLVRRWGGTGAIADNYNAVTGSFVGTTWSANGIEFRANGTYESADLYQQTSRCMVYIDKGRYTVAGNRIRLMPTTLQQHVCGSPQVTTRPGTIAPADHVWRMQYSSGQSLNFELIAASKLRDARDWYYATQYVATAP